METTLTATVRTARGKQLAALRMQGLLPAVVYGPKESTIAMSINLIEFQKMFKEAGESTIITLKGLDHDKDVLVHDVAYDPVSGSLLHVDFYAIEKDKMLQVGIPIEFEGESPTAKLGGVVTKVLHEIEVECLPRNLPQHFTVDLSNLTEIGQQIHIKDLKFPEGVTAVNDPEDVIVVISEIEEEKEEAPTPVDMDAIEVEKKGKDEPAEEGAAEAE